MRYDDDDYERDDDDSYNSRRGLGTGWDLCATTDCREHCCGCDER